MPLLIRSCHRHRFPALLEGAGRVMRDGVGAGAGDGAIHLINLDASARVIAAVWVAPRPDAGVAPGLPPGAEVVQISPLCADPRLERSRRQRTLLELRAGLGRLFLRQAWTHAVAVGPDPHIQPFIVSGMAVRVLGAASPAGGGPLSFTVLVSDPDPRQFEADGPFDLQDPDEDPSLFTRFGDRAVA